jgi:23S rRNA pseudoU1915 N3-methylase RlmH
MNYLINISKYEFDFLNMVWKEIQTFNSPSVSLHTMTIVNNNYEKDVFIFGGSKGISQKILNSDLYKFTFDTPKYLLNLFNNKNFYDLFFE